MKNKLLLILAFCFISGMTQAFNVTFSVDMNGVSGFTTPNVNGTFNGWCGPCNPMTDGDLDGVWDVVIDIPAGFIEYKFSADGWNIQESLVPGTGCTLTTSGFTNRVITVSGDVTLPTVCWGLCTTCALAPPTYPITFQVDMTLVTPGSFTTPTVNGSFAGWCGNCNLLTDANSDGIWETTFSLPAGSYEYKFAADNWNTQESLAPGSACTVTNSGFTNRTLVVGSSAQTLTPVCWGYCQTCNSIAVPHNVTFKVDMTQQTGFTIPELNGNFNGWCGNCTPMTDANSDGIWEVIVPLTAGNYEYKFSHDAWGGQEALTPGSSCTVTNSGFTNRTLTMGFTDVVLPTVCYNSCSACVPPSYNVTFQLDMTSQSGFGTPEVNGTFNGWCGNCNPMTDANSDGIWEATIPLQAGPYEYKFSYDAWTGQENLVPGSSCTATNSGFTNRTLVVGSSNMTIPVVCYGSCLSCSSPSYNVTFRIDMNQQSGFTIPEVNGSFNGWCGSCNAMTDANGDGIWQTTIALLPGNYEYKFSHDGWAGQEGLTAGSSCTVTNSGFTNRALVVGAASQTLPVVCYNSCNSCATASSNVTFRVDMSQVTGYGIPEVNGTFNGWCGNCNPMTDANSDGVWEVTIPLQAGNFEYKFSHDAWGGQENLTPGSSCTMTTSGFTNRVLTVGSVAQVLPVVCYGLCTSCSQYDSPASAALVSYSSNGSYPNCYAINGSTTTAGNSPESAGFAGPDVWYKFIAQSTGASITMVSSSMDDAIALYSKSGASYILVDAENASSGASDFERLNVTGLIPGTTYYVSIGSATGLGSGGAFTLCIQHLMPSSCAYAIPSGGFSLCNSYKAIFRGAPSQGVTYGFNFNGVGGGASGLTSLIGTNGLITLGNPALALRYGGVYDVSVDVNYSLLNSTGGTESIVVLGSIAATNCNDVNIRVQPNVEVKLSQRCPASLLRSNWLIATPVSGNPNACGATSYTYKFTKVTSCTNGTILDLPVEYNTLATTPYLQLGNLVSLPNTGAWDVSVRPNFSYGNGVYGPSQRISVAGTAAAAMLPESEMYDDTDRMLLNENAVGIYPNPNNGEMVNINLTDVKSGQVFVRVLDITGRVIYSNRFAVDGTLNTIIAFNQKLTSGIYFVEFTDGIDITTEKMLVRK